MLWSAQDSTESLKTEEADSDSSFWKELEDLDIGIDHIPEQRQRDSVNLKGLINTTFKHAMEYQEERTFYRSTNRPRTKLEIPKEVIKTDQDFDAKIEVIRSATGEKVRNAIAVLTKRMIKERDEKLMALAEDHKKELEQMEEHNTDLSQTIFKKDVEIRYLYNLLMEQEAILLQFKVSKTQTETVGKIKGRAFKRRQQRMGPVNMGRLFEELDAQKSTIETLRHTLDITRSNQTDQSSTIRNLRRDLSVIEDRQDQTLTDENNLLKKQLRTAEEEVERLSKELADMKDFADKEILIRDELSRRSSQTIDQMRGQLKLAAQFVNNPRLQYKVKEKLVKKAGSRPQSQQRQTATAAYNKRKKRPWVLCSSEQVSPRNHYKTD